MLFFCVFWNIIQNMSITYNPKNKKRKRTHGFLSRMKTVGGKNTVSRRRSKGRARVSC